MADLETLQGWLTEAEAQLQKATLGKVKVQAAHGAGGSQSSMTFNQVDPDALRMRIAELKGQIARLTGAPPTRGVMYVA